MTWWLSLIVLVIGLILARQEFLAEQTFWRRDPSLDAFLKAGLIGILSALQFIFISTVRASAIGSNGKALTMNLLLLPIPFWIYCLGFLPTKLEDEAAPVEAAYWLAVRAIAWIITISGIAIVTFFFLSRNHEAEPDLSFDELSGNDFPTYGECVVLGIAYFKEIESFPRLRSTGELVEDVVPERCLRSSWAFGGGR